MKNGYLVQYLSVRNGYRSKTRLSEVGTWPKLGCQKWSPDRNSSVRYGHLTNEQVTICHRHVLVRWQYFTDEFWSGDHFWQPSFGLVTISYQHILDSVPIFHQRLLRVYWKKAKILKNSICMQANVKHSFIRFTTKIIHCTICLDRPRPVHLLHLKNCPL